MKKLLTAVATSLVILSTPTLADNYQIDTEHTFVQFRVKHLGYSWLNGRFNDFSGNFSYDEAKLGSNSVSIEIKAASVDTHHAERDKHIRSGDFLNTDKHPTVKFVSTSYQAGNNETATVTGNLTFNGVTKPVTLDVVHVGGGEDPWGGFRQGFQGTATLKPAEFGMDLAENLGAAAAEVELTLSIEGIRE
ncbi:MAG: YceI family protein [Halioglobus sp.]|mgnify:CR=1 FL=1|nr:YceI family protein [Halioglobus sp.]